MKTEEVQKLDHGVYRVHWKDPNGPRDANSVCAVGSKHNGQRWICCSNWTSDRHHKTDAYGDDIWEQVESVLLLAKQ